MIYTFNEEDALRFAHEQNISTRRHGDELQFSECPYCHSRDKSRPFSISLATGQFTCLRASCGRRGNMITLAKDFGFSLGYAADEYHRIRTKAFRTLETPAEGLVASKTALQYLTGRGISPEVVVSYRITRSQKDENVLVFPFYDEAGKLTFVKYRNTAYQKEDGGSKEWCEPDCKPILFGMDHCKSENRTLILTEGQIDSLSVTTAGYDNAVSVPLGKNGFTWLPHCWDWLHRFDRLIVFGDLENGKMSLLEEMRLRFPGTILHVRDEDYQGCKDANELLCRFGVEAVRRAIDNAAADPDENLMDLAAVAPEDMEKRECIASGLRGLDRVLGGFALGTLVLLTGERGKGKSTLGSQFLCQSLLQGYPVMAYSGELTHANFREWIDRQLSGTEVVPYKTERGFSDWTVTKEKREQLAQWYGGRAFIYDAGSLAEAARGQGESGGLLSAIERAAMRYGIKVFLVDNMMSVLLSGDLGPDLNNTQSAFVAALAALCRRYGILIFLVAHPRKQQEAMKFTNDAVMGSGNITNLADVVLNYTDRGAEESGCTRLLQLTKNRATGECCDIPLWYDRASKRISEKPGDFTWARRIITIADFQEEKEKDGEKDDLPF